MAFFLYQYDRLYDLKQVFQGLRGSIKEKSRGFTTSNDPEVYIDSEWVFGLAMIILSFVIATKRVFASKVSPITIDDEQELEEKVLLQRVAGVQPKFDSYAHACERITEEEFDY